MPDLDVLRELQVYLIAQGIGQAPSSAPSLTVPSIWLMPRDGSPLPRDGENITITLHDTMMRSPSSMEPWMQEAFVDVIVRSRQPTPGKLLQRTIGALIAPWGLPGGRHQWMMGGLLVETSDQWRGDQPMPQRQDTSQGDPHISYDRVASYRFVCRRKVLAGLSMP
jgi:hypothetical protein